MPQLWERSIKQCMQATLGLSEGPCRAARRQCVLRHVQTTSNIKDKAVKCHLQAGGYRGNCQHCNAVGTAHVLHCCPSVMVQFRGNVALTITFLNLSTLFTSSVVTAERFAWRANFCASCKCQQRCA